MAYKCYHFKNHQQKTIEKKLKAFQFINQIYNIQLRTYENLFFYLEEQTVIFCNLKKLRNIQKKMHSIIELR